MKPSAKNLFWNTRHLTSAREDHLTYFVAAALEADPAFRAAYAACVLGPLAGPQGVPEIASVTPQVAFPEQQSYPDMMLVLRDGRRVICEHKIDAGETVLPVEEGKVSRQLERYLELPGVDALCYFRSALRPPSEHVLRHERYLRPESGAAHYLWRELYEPLGQGDHELSRWLREGFLQLGFSPPHPHIGALRPNEDPQVQENQRNFGKLWHRTRTHFEPAWRMETGSRCQLYLNPKGPSRAAMILLSPLAQDGTLLMVRVHVPAESIADVRDRLEAAAVNLEVPPDVTVGRAQNGRKYVDLLAPLSLVLGSERDAVVYEARLFEHVAPLIEATEVDEEETTA